MQSRPRWGYEKGYEGKPYRGIFLDFKDPRKCLK